MPITSEWVIEGLLLEQTYVGDISLEELVEETGVATAALDSARGQHMYILVDNSRTTSSPDNLKELRQILPPVLRHPKLAMIVVSGQNNPLLRFVEQTIAAMFGIPLWFVATRADALRYLAMTDRHIAALLEDAS
ncbi:MAG: hypothetical protein AAFR56_01765 [Chloroflexota bacterium]